MTTEKANKIFRNWKEYVEINDKLSKIFMAIPESFLPYPIEVLEEALNIIAKSYFDKRDYKACHVVQESICTLGSYKDDEEAIKTIIDDFILKDSKSRELFLANLKKARDSWAKLKEST